MTKEYTIGIIGLGYVGLPLAIAFADHFNVVGFDINQQRSFRSKSRSGSNG